MSAMVVNGPTTTGAAVISSRRLHLGARLLNAGVGVRFMLLQTTSAGVKLPALHPPLLLDTWDLGFVQSAALLVDLATRRPAIPTIVLIDPEDVAIRAILPICPAIYAIVSDTVDLRLLGPLIRLGGICGVDRMHHVEPYWAGVRPIQRTLISLEELEILLAMARAESLEGAVECSGMARRTFYRKLGQLRSNLNLPPATRGTRIEEHVTSVIGALANLGQSASDPALPLMQPPRHLS
jgi:hypothetical protein